MARILTRGVHRQSKSEKIEVSDGLCLEMQEFHVLAVDDSFVDRKVIERLLKVSSCKVTVVDSGQRALRFLGLDEEKSPTQSKGLKVHLIITDYSMPGMTGYELLKRIKQESSMFREVPVVIMSSENILTRIARCIEEGAKEYIVKPVKLSDVKRLRQFIATSHPNGVKEKESHDLSIRETGNPIFVGFPCSSPECPCISKHPCRHHTRSSKYESQLTLP